MIKIAIPGSAGRMGGMLIRAIAAAPDLELVAATDLPDSPFIGRDAGEVAQIGTNGVMIGSDPETLFGVADVVIDFTSPAASLHHASLAAAKGTAMVIGTTGLGAEEEAALKAMAKDNRIIYCANTSVGVTLLTQLVEEVAAKLTDGWDIEILETHHPIRLMRHQELRSRLAKLRQRGVVLRLMMLPIWFEKARQVRANRAISVLLFCVVAM